ncbi:MAG TPA: hypothetical protein PKE47_13725, partial [Verrucomicrobiota bacterium]|nr:hypothetical protein [Verrucomicrobiota bacterium]
MFRVRRPAALLLLLALNLRAEPTPLIPRELFLAPPERTAPLLSPDGARLAWLAVTNGVPALFVRTLGVEGDRVAMTLRRPVTDMHWTPGGEGVLFTQDTEDGVPHLFLLELGAGSIRDLTPFVGAAARLITVNLNEPEIILAAISHRGRGLPEPHAINLLSGALLPAAENVGGFAAWHADNRMRLRMAQAPLSGGTNELRFRPDEEGVWRPFLRWGPDDTVRFLGFTPGDESVWVASDAGTNAQRLLQLRLDQTEARVLAADPRFDVA